MTTCNNKCLGACSVDQDECMGMGQKRLGKAIEYLKNIQKKCSVTGNRTPVSRVTGGDTSHYTMTELLLHYEPM
jgi:hypothetical protein